MDLKKLISNLEFSIIHEDDNCIKERLIHDVIPYLKQLDKKESK